MTGRTFGTLKPLRLTDRHEHGRPLWSCLCDPALGGCGKEVFRTASALNKVKSCGCRRNNGRPSKHDRNAEVYERWQAGESCTELADEFIITSERVMQLVRNEAKHRGEELREKLHKNCIRVPTEIPDQLLEDVQHDRIKVAAAAKQTGFSKGYIRYRVKQHCGSGPMKLRSARYRELAQEVYEQFMSGAKMAELAERLGKTVNYVGQLIIRHRRRIGAPAKCPHLKPHKNGSKP